jgi:predicted TPR repeat methyltransferase
MTGAPLFASSGNAAADREYRLAIERVASGDLVGAAEILRRTVKLAPAFATAWFALGPIRDNLGAGPGAISAWQNASDADPEDYHGARLQLARLGAGEGTPAMTGAYLRRLFDQQAARFDETLVERLDYRGPAILLDAVRKVAAVPLRIGSMLDLGCGTGLSGGAFRPYVDWLVGVDLSPAMVGKAGAKGIYDRLTVSDLRDFLDAQADARAHYHLVLVYLNDLAPVAAAAARVLAPGGLFAFSVETHPDDRVVVQPTLRYSHGEAHVHIAIAQAGLKLLRLDQASIRTERGASVPCLVVVASNIVPTAPTSTVRAAS